MRETIYSIIKTSTDGAGDFELSIPEREAFGHYSTNVALRSAKILCRPPMEVAEELASRIRKSAPQGFFDKIETAPPGFINFWLSTAAIQREFELAVRKKEKYGRGNPGKGKCVIVEYSQPNIAKKMHIGHLRTTVLGDALANCYAWLGYRVIRWNYLGDWGTQFGKLIAAYKLWGNKTAVQKKPIETLLALYVRFHDEMKRVVSLEDRGREEFRKLEEGDRENLALWRWFKKESLKEFARAYKRIGVAFNVDIGESFFEKEIGPLSRELVRKGIARESEGAIVVPLEQFNLPPALIQKSDGATLYLSRDIANARYRLLHYRPEKILYVVGNEQSLHFEQLFRVMELLSWGRGVELAHVKYGLVLAEEGKKFATREGRVVFLDEVLDKAVELAHGIVKEKNPSLSRKEQSLIAEAVGIGALKYVNLKENRHSDIVFNWERILDFSGDSAPYLQYTYARLLSIARKAGRFSSGKAALLNEERELRIMRALFEFPEAVTVSAKTYATNHLAKYTYELAVQANGFYESTPILKDENKARRAARLALIQAVLRTLKSGLELLGIKVVSKI